MERFSILDHFILSGILFDKCVNNASVIHHVDNTSDHDPITLQLTLDAKYVGTSKRTFTPRLSWVRATQNDLQNYRSCLGGYLSETVIPTEAILCCDLQCQDCTHHNALSKYAEAITDACKRAGEECIPCTSDRESGGRIPGWSERVEPVRSKSLFWHGLWIECGRPRTGVVADCMRRTRAAYHYAIRGVRKDEENIVRERVAQTLLKDPGRNFWAEIKKLRNAKAGSSRIVDGCTEESGISDIFASKYKSLYSSVPYDASEMQKIHEEVDARISNDKMSDCVINSFDVRDAIAKLHVHKTDGNFCLCSDHFIHAGSELSVHVAFLFTSIVSHGSAPADFVRSTVLPIPKKSNACADSDNYRGIALSSIFGKLLDHIILCKYQDRLSTSDLQFGFKKNRSTNMCTMVLKETLSYYVNNHSSAYCTFLDASKAFDRVNYCKLFNLLLKRGLPACIIRLLINMYTGNMIRVSWAGLMSSYFTALNGVKQGGVMSPILFCIYIDDLLIQLSQSGAGCYIGLTFVGALAYADDIVLIGPTPSAMRKMLSVCDSFASDYDIVFNATKSKYLVAAAKRQRSLLKTMNECLFYIGGQPIENVMSYSHLGHVINARLDDTDDILQICNSFVGQTNNVLCVFNKLDTFVKLKLFKAYCNSMYGCELWSLDCRDINEFCVSWRKAIRRVLDIPYSSHSALLPLLTDTLPALDEICKRSARFITSCLKASSHLVRTVVLHSIVHVRYNSPIGKNALFCCERFGWCEADFVSGEIDLIHKNFMDQCMGKCTEQEINSALALSDVMSIREGYATLGCPDEPFLSREEINCIIFSLACE
jgi:hypothetical protein